MESTKLTNLEVTGTLKADDVELDVGTKVTADDATAAAGSAPTKAEFDAAVTLCNAIKASLNGLIDDLTGN